MDLLVFTLIILIMRFLIKELNSVVFILFLVKIQKPVDIPYGLICHHFMGCFEHFFD